MELKRIFDTPKTLKLSLIKFTRYNETDENMKFALAKYFQYAFE